MKTSHIVRRGGARVRRAVAPSTFWLVPLVASVLAVSCVLAGSVARAADPAPLKIGVIGTGNIGGNLAKLWAKAGHELVISSRHPEELQDLARSLGPKVRVGNPREAAEFGSILSHASIVSADQAG